MQSNNDERRDDVMTQEHSMSNTQIEGRKKISIAAMTKPLQLALLASILMSQWSHTTSMALTSSKLLHSQAAQAPSSFMLPPSQSRRHALFTAAAFLTAVPQPANALKERNEALCATGFFTNIGQWYCTPIGNIADEGQSGVLSSDQEDVADSLMSKLGMTDQTTTITSESKTKTSLDESTAMGASFSDTNP